MVVTVFLNEVSRVYLLSFSGDTPPHPHPLPDHFFGVFVVDVDVGVKTLVGTFIGKFEWVDNDKRSFPVTGDISITFYSTFFSSSSLDTPFALSLCSVPVVTELKRSSVGCLLMGKAVDIEPSLRKGIF